MDGAIVRKMTMNCPLCGKIHEIEERRTLSKTIIKNEDVEYEVHFFFCANSPEGENEFESGKLVNENLLRARNAYREKKGLLTSGQIVEIRNIYGLSQVELAKLLGWGEATISRYETKQIQDESYDYFLRIIKEDPYTALRLLDKNKEAFSEDRYLEIRDVVLKRLQSVGKEHIARELLSSRYVKYEEPSELNGHTRLNIDKLEACISYLAKKVKNLYKVKLMKLLWYADSISYKQNGASITGLVYMHEALGALPLGHYEIVNLEWVKRKEFYFFDTDSTAFLFLPCKDVNLNVLSPQERKILDKVIERFADYTSSDIVEYMHEETAYLQTKDKDVISFVHADSLRDF